MTKVEAQERLDDAILKHRETLQRVSSARSELGKAQDELAAAEQAEREATAAERDALVDYSLTVKG